MEVLAVTPPATIHLPLDKLVDAANATFSGGETGLLDLLLEYDNTFSIFSQKTGKGNNHFGMLNKQLEGSVRGVP